MFAEALTRARRVYRVVQMETLQRIAWLCMSQGSTPARRGGGREFRQRPAYQEGFLTDEPDLSVYDETPHRRIAPPMNQKARTTMNEELRKILKYLRLGGTVGRLGRLLVKAQRGRFSHERLLQHVLEAEYRVKLENARLLRRKRARRPRDAGDRDTFPFVRQPKLDRKKIMSLYDSFDYMTKQRNIVWLGRRVVARVAAWPPDSCCKRSIGNIAATSSPSPSC